MSPSAEERLATLEAERRSDRELLQEIKIELKRLPRRISNNTRKQLERCRTIQDGKHAKKIEPIKTREDDGSMIRKVLVAILSLGTLLGGAVYQFAQEKSKTTKSGITQQGAKP